MSFMSMPFCSDCLNFRGAGGSGAGGGSGASGAKPCSSRALISRRSCSMMNLANSG